MKLTRTWVIGLAAILAWVNLAVSQDRPRRSSAPTRRAGAEVREDLQPYDLLLSTYFGGSGADLLRDMTVDAQGNIYVAGIAGSVDFPRTPPEIAGQSKSGGMVAKFRRVNSAGTRGVP